MQFLKLKKYGICACFALAMLLWFSYHEGFAQDKSPSQVAKALIPTMRNGDGSKGGNTKLEIARRQSGIPNSTSGPNLHQNGIRQAETTVKRDQILNDFEPVKIGPVDESTLALNVTGTPIEFLPNYKNPCWKDHQETDAIEQVGGALKIHCLPYFYLAGQPKCGTTDLYYQLTQNPDIAKCSMKEPHWWTRKRVGKFVKTPVPFWRYLRHFENATQTISSSQSVNGLHHIITGEASASTLWDNDKWRDVPWNANLAAPKYLTAHYIHALTPNAKIIIILRNPTVRLYSDALYFGIVDPSPEMFHHLVVNGIAIMENCIKKMGVRSCAYNGAVAMEVGVRLRVGMYYTFIKDWLEVFPRDQIYITRLEDYSVDRLSVLNEIYHFLGVRTTLMNETVTLAQTESVKNKGKKHERAAMFDTTKQLLDNFYKPYNQKLAALLDDDRFLWES